MTKGDLGGADRWVPPAMASSLETRFGARLATLVEALPLLVSPDTRRPLVLRGDVLVSRNGCECFPIRAGLPVLFPAQAHAYLGPDRLEVPWGHYSDSFAQYLLITAIKQHYPEHNSPRDNPWFQRHLAWTRDLMSGAQGIVLDVGCDDPILSAELFPAGTVYLGLDPLYGDAGPFRLVGMAEFLPLADGSIDAVCLLTSLDHVFDWHRAIDEACRVLKLGGTLFVASLVWTDRADLHGDHVHFHHFREYELLGAIGHLSLASFRRYPWKDDGHRSVVYLSARKVR